MKLSCHQLAACSICLRVTSISARSLPTGIIISSPFWLALLSASPDFT